MTAPLRPNGHTIRVFEHKGHSISEVEFVVEDLGYCIGYMVGPNDGYATLYVDPDQAIAAKFPTQVSR